MINKNFSLRLKAAFIMAAMVFIYGCRKELLPELHDKEVISSSARQNVIPGEYIVVFSPEYARDIQRN
ncbi:MAG: hypothetical protein H0X62_15005 [Bacteroidetes bacterium]|nr:hypothetical protein [Bacteroidota bacterium]